MNAINYPLFFFLAMDRHLAEIYWYLMVSYPALCSDPAMLRCVVLLFFVAGGEASRGMDECVS